MKKKQKITKNAKSLTGMMLGVLAALVILFSQSFYFEYVASVEGEATKEQISDVDTDETVIKI